MLRSYFLSYRVRVYSYSHLLIIIIKAILCIVTVAVACVFTVIFYLWLHWITAKRTHPFAPAKQTKIESNLVSYLVK